ncbi:Cellular morphogenesis protein, partial [Aspergillus sclerotialis]
RPQPLASTQNSARVRAPELGKREQRAKKEKDEKLLERIGEEIGALKALEYAPTATNYIFKQMLKTKSIAESAGFNEFKQTKNICVSGPRSTAEANVTARMFKSKPVQGVMPGIMDEGDEKEKKRENAKARLDEEARAGGRGLR